MLRSHATRAAALLLLALAGCGDSPTGGGTPEPAAVQAVSGDAQSAVAGAALASPLVVRVTDDQGRPVAGAAVGFRVSAGGGSVASGLRTTNADGLAEDRWTLGTSVADSQRVEVQTVDAATGQTRVWTAFRATARPDAPASIVPVSPAASTGTAGFPLADSLAARVLDRWGNPVPNVPVVWTVQRGGGSVAPAQSTTDAGGIARAQWILGARADSMQVVNAAAGVGISTSFAALAASSPQPATLAVVSGNGQTGVAGTELAQPLVVELRRADGGPAAGAVVVWSATNGTVNPASSVTDAQGRAQTRWTLPTQAGEAALVVSSPGVMPAGFTATVTHAAPAQLVKVGGDAQTGAAGQLLAAPLRVRVVDAFGNPVAGQLVQWTPAAGNGTVQPDTIRSNAAGDAATTWRLGSATGAQSVTAGSGSLAPVTFTAQAGAPAENVQVQFIQPTPTDPVGDTVNFTLHVTSEYQVQSVVVEVEGRTVQLQLNNSGQWAGSLPLAGLAQGPKAANVTVTDVRGAVAVRSGSFAFNRAPALTVISPQPQDATTDASVRVQASCTDDYPGPAAAPCTLLVAILVPGQSLTVVEQGGSSIDVVVPLTNYVGRAVYVSVYATDPGNARRSISVPIYVNNGTTLARVDTAGYEVLDIDATRVLYRDSTAAGRVLKVRARGGGTPQVVLGAHGRTELVDARLTAYGVAYQRARSAMVDWRNGTSTTLASNLEGDCRIGTHYVACPGRRFDLGTGQVTTLPAGMVTDVAPNGDVAFRDGSRAGWLHGQTVVDLGFITGDPLRPVLTDGIQVIYVREDSIYLLQGTGQPAGVAPVRASRSDYGVNNGWAAWPYPINPQQYSDPAQIFTRSPDGVVRQATLFSGGAYLGSLGPSGQVVFHRVTNPRTMLAVPPYTSPVDLGNLASGRFRWVGDELYRLSGRTVLRVNY